MFYCTLILGGIIGLCNVLPGVITTYEVLYNAFFYIFIAFIVWGIAGSLIEISKIDK